MTSSLPPGPPRRGRLRAVSILSLFLIAGVTGGCSSSGATGPGEEDPGLGALIGRWEATSMVLRSENDESISVDIVQDERFSGSFVLTIQEGGRYTATLAVFGQERVERGTLTRSGDTLIFSPAGGQTSRVDWERTGDQLTIDGKSSFDFNGDGEDEPAELHQELIRS